MTTTSAIGFLGLGNMGRPMAEKLMDGGHRLTVHDVREAALEPFLARQASRADNPKQMADMCEVAFVSLPTLNALQTVCLGTGPNNGMVHGTALKLLVNTCTVGVPMVEQIAAACAARGITLVDCPISGGPPGARAGTLSVMVSGDPQAIEKIRPLISLWGRTVVVAGDRPGLAQVLKLTNNILSFVALAATCEAFVMGAKGGVGLETMIEAVNAGSGRNSATLDKVPRSIATRTFAYGGDIDLLIKDADLAIAQGEALGVPMWVCQAARLIFKHAQFAGHGSEDFTAIVKQIETAAGFQLPKTR